jgi:hypothetical protein
VSWQSTSNTSNRYYNTVSYCVYPVNIILYGTVVPYTITTVPSVAVYYCVVYIILYMLYEIYNIYVLYVLHL